MLNVKTLEEELKKAFSETLPLAFEEAMKSTFPQDSELGADIAKTFGEVIDDLVSESLAQRIAAAIDYHIRSATIYGNIITVGGPTTQYATINSPSPLTNGVLPNSLGIK